MKEDKLKRNADKLGVGVDVYIFLRQSNRKLRYFAHDLKEEKIIVTADSVTFLPSREDSFDRLISLGADFAADEKSVEDIVVDAILREQLHVALGKLDDGERRLIDEIFFSQDGEGRSVRELAESLGIPQKTVNNRKLRILAKLKKYIEMQK